MSTISNIVYCSTYSKYLNKKFRFASCGRFLLQAVVLIEFEHVCMPRQRRNEHLCQRRLPESNHVAQWNGLKILLNMKYFPWEQASNPFPLPKVPRYLLRSPLHMIQKAKKHIKLLKIASHASRDFMVCHWSLRANPLQHLNHFEGQCFEV